MTRLLANIKSGNARHIKFETKGLPADVGNIRPIGGYNANQAVKGITNSNVQSAIEDIYSLVVDPIKINGIYISTDSTTPEAQKHVEIITFIGAQISENIEDTGFYILGEHFNFDSLTSTALVINEIIERFELKAINNELVTKVVKRGTDQIEFTFIDSVPKDLSINYVKNGISYTSEVDVQGKPGYGTWIKLGQETKFENTLHYYKRIA